MAFPTADGVFSQGALVTQYPAEGANEILNIQQITMNAANLWNKAKINLSTNTTINISQTNVATENRPLNFGMTPAICLPGV